MKILFLRPGKLGDMIVATPLFRIIKRTFPECYIAVVSSPYNEIIIRYNSNVNHLRKVNYHSLLDIYKMILWIRRQQFDWVIDLTPGISRTSTLISRFVKSHHIKTAGMHKGKFARYFNRVTDYHGIHIIDKNVDLIEKIFECKFTGDFNPDIFYPEESEKKAIQLLDRVSVSTTLIGINCSAGEECRQWSEENYERIIQLIIEKYRDFRIVLFSVGEQSVWAKRLESASKNTIAITGTDLLTVSALIKHMSFFVTPDTSLLHIASAFKLPIVGLYSVGGENFIRWRAYGTLNRELIAQKTENVNEISPAEVFKALVELINSLERNSV